MRKLFAATAAVLALAGRESNGERQARVCAYTVNVPSWNNCVENHNAGEAARQASDNALAAAMRAGGALNFRQPAPRFTTCTAAGCITQ